MFHSLQCVQKGRVRLPREHRGSTVFADDYGGAWVVTADARKVMYYKAETLETAMSQRLAVPPPYVNATSAKVFSSSSPPPPVYTLAFQCNEQLPEKGAESTDRVHSILFFNSDVGAKTAASFKSSASLSLLQQQRRDACIVTENGTIAFVRVPTTSSELPVLLQPYQEVHLGLRVCATTATANAIILCCFDGEFTEVVRAVVVPEAETLSGSTCPHLSANVLPDALCAYEVEAVGLFRVQGCIQCILYEGADDYLIAVSDAGNVDVWDVANGVDVTAQFGAPAWDTMRHGTATCAIMCRDKLWVGLSSGELLVFSIVQNDSVMATERAQRSTGIAGTSPAGLLRLRSHNSPISGIIAMSMQSSVWSCAADNGKVNVWDATDASFRGSFVFPESGFQSWYCGVAQLRTALWGVDSATGEPCLLQVGESMSRGDVYVCGDVETRERRAQETLVNAYRACWRGLLCRFAAVSRNTDNKNDEEATEDWDNDIVTAALQRIDADNRGDVTGASVSSMRALLDTVDSLRRLCAVDRRARGGHARAVAVVLDECIADWQQRADSRSEVESFLSFLSTPRGAGSNGSGAVRSLDDARDEFQRLYAEIEVLQNALEEAKQSNVDEAIAAAAEEATDVLRKELASVQDALRNAEGHILELRKQLDEAHEEAQSAVAQQASLERALEDTEAQLAEAKKSLLATKRAAEVTASEVSSLFDMESKLHASQQVIAELSAKVEALVKEAEVRGEELSVFYSKQKTAKEVLRSVLRAQNAIADSVSDFADSLDQMIAETTRGQPNITVETLKRLLETIREDTFALEASMESRLREQKTWFHSLTAELKAAMMQQ